MRPGVINCTVCIDYFKTDTIRLKLAVHKLEAIEKPCDSHCTPCRLLWEDAVGVL